MNKAIVITVVALLLLGMGYLWMNSKDDSMNKTATKMGQMEGERETSSSDERTLKELIASGNSLKCTYKDLSDDYDIEGTTYVADGKVRGDFTTKVNGKDERGHTIYDGKKSYFWMDGQQQGTMMEVNDLSTFADEDEESYDPKQGMDLNKKIDFNCSTWDADTAFFTPPDDIVFSQFTIPDMSQGDAMTSKENLCESCNSLSGEQKDACLNALNCN